MTASATSLAQIVAPLAEFVAVAESEIRALKREVAVLHDTLDLVLFAAAGGNFDEEIRRELFAMILQATKQSGIDHDLDGLLGASARDSEAARVRELVRRVREH